MTKKNVNVGDRILVKGDNVEVTVVEVQEKSSDVMGIFSGWQELIVKTDDGEQFRIGEFDEYEKI